MYEHHKLALCLFKKKLKISFDGLMFQFLQKLNDLKHGTMSSQESDSKISHYSVQKASVKTLHVVQKPVDGEPSWQLPTWVNDPGELK